MSDDENDPAWDPTWDDTVFDDTFVDAAPIAEPSAEERRRVADHERRVLALEAQRSSDRADAAGIHRTTRWRRFRTRAIAIGAVIALIAGGLALDRVAPPPETSSENAGPVGDMTVDAMGLRDAGVDRPTPSRASQNEPLGEPAAAPRAGGPHRFVAKQPGTDDPVAYDPCRPIPFVVNAEHAPAGASDLLADAIARVGAVTGLAFEAEGPSDEPPSEARAAFQPEVYGDRWAPVVIWWTTPDDAPTLAGSVAGFAGSTWIEIDDPRGRRTGVYVTGTVALDGPQIEEIRRTQGRASAESVILHELGHLVGLDHVDDPDQIMNPTGSPEVTDFADGDLTGLNQLGRGACFPEL